MGIIQRWALGLTAACLGLHAASAMSADADLVIEHVKVLSPPDLPIDDGSVAVTAGRITYVGKSAGFTGKATRHLDGRGKTLIPGLIDSHTHLFIGPKSQAEYHAYVKEHLEDKFTGYLSQGVTTVMTMGDYYPDILSVRDAVKQGLIKGPRILISGPMIAPTNGHPTDIKECVGNDYCRHHWAMQVDDVESARRGVRDLAKNKVDMIKISYDGREYGNPTSDGKTGQKLGHFKPEVMRALIDEAHAQGLRAAVYATPVENEIQAMEWGADVLSHAPIVIHMRPDGSVIDWPHPLLEKFTAMAVERKIPFATTIASLSVNPDLWGTRRLLHTGDDVSAWPQDLQKMVDALYKQSLMDAKILMDRGALVAYGSDIYRLSAREATRHELGVLHDAGLSADQVITMATRNSAKLIGREKDLGSITTGKIADLVLLAGDPQRNFEALARVDLVLKDGQVAYDFYK